MLGHVALEWNLEPFQLAPTVVVALLYARRVRTLARRGIPTLRTDEEGDVEIDVNAGGWQVD